MRRSLLCIVLAAVAIGLLSITTTAQTDARDTLLVASSLDIQTIDPQVNTTLAGAAVIRNVYEPLVRYKRDTLELEPVLAESWSANQGGLVYTFNLRKGVKFHDGTDFDAQAVKYTFDRLFAIDKGPANLFRVISRVDVVDPHVIRMTMKRPFPNLPQVLAGVFGAYVVSPTTFKAQERNGDWAEEWARRNAVGTGPYRLVQWTPGDRVVLEKYDTYWGGWAGEHVSRVILREVREASTQRLLIQSGQADVAERIQPEDIPQLLSNPGVQVLKYPSFTTHYIFFHTKRGPIANKKVRQALSYAVDYDKMIQFIMNRDAARLLGPLPQRLKGAVAVSPYKYDLARAKALLSDAGFPQGGFSLSYMYIGLEYQRQVGELLQSNWAQLGVQVKLDSVTVAVGRQRREREETSPDMFIYYSVPRYSDPDAMLYDMFSSRSQPPRGANWGWYRNQRVDDLLEQARYGTDQSKRMEMYAEAQKLIVDDAPALFLMTTPEYIFARSNVKGLVYNPMYSRAMYFYPVRKL